MMSMLQIAFFDSNDGRQQTNGSFEHGNVDSK
jgi:hypothetical protein